MSRLGSVAWSKVLTASDAQRVAGSNQAGGIRLTKAGCQGIDHTTYFRHQLFGSCTWTLRAAAPYAEHATARFEVYVLGEGCGVLELTLSWRPQSEAQQRNYTTTLHLGRELRQLFRRHDVTGCRLYLHRPGKSGDFALVIEKREET